MYLSIYLSMYRFPLAGRYAFRVCPLYWCEGPISFGLSLRRRFFFRAAVWTSKFQRLYIVGPFVFFSSVKRHQSDISSPPPHVRMPPKGNLYTLQRIRFRADQNMLLFSTRYFLFEQNGRPPTRAQWLQCCCFSLRCVLFFGQGRAYAEPTHATVLGGCTYRYSFLRHQPPLKSFIRIPSPQKMLSFF